MPEGVGYQKVEFNGEIVEFPKDMPDEEIAEVLRGEENEKKSQEVLRFLAKSGWDLQEIE